MIPAEKKMKVESILESATTAWGDRSLVVDSLGSYSYRELLSASHDVALFLRSRGIHPGEAIAFSANEARAFIPLLFGILIADCVALPISPQLSEDEKRHYENTADIAATLSVTIQPRPELTSVTLPGLSQAILIKRSPSLHGKVRAAFPDAAVMRFTSGTTSLAKGVVLSHVGVLERAATCQQIFEVTGDDRVLSPLPLSYHFIASVMSFIRAGATILDGASLAELSLVQFVRDTSPTFAYAAPSHYATLCEHARTQDLLSLRKAISASAPLQPEQAKLFQSRFNRRLVQAYGIIEVGLPVWNDSVQWRAEVLGAIKPPYECRLVDETNRAGTASVVGELAVRGPGLFSGYILNSGEIYKHNSGEWFRTGDLIERGGDGSLIFKGRKQSRILLDQRYIYPEEIESVLKRLPEVVEARVSAEYHPSRGSHLIAEIVPRDETLNSPRSLRSLCEQALPPHLRPKEFRVRTTIPRTGSGKVMRRVNGANRSA